MRTSRGVRGACIGLALVLALSVVHAADARTSVLTPDLGRRLAAAGKADRVLVLVHGVDASTAERAAGSRGLVRLETWERIGIVAAVGTPAQVRSLDGAPGITRVEGDQPVEFLTNTSHIATRGIEAIKGFAARGLTGWPKDIPAADGRGVSIAVIDTGVDGTHPMLQQDGKSKVVRNMTLACTQPFFFLGGVVEGVPDLPPSTCPHDYDAGDDPWLDFTSNNDTDTLSAGGHGTHVASTAAGVPVTTADGRKLSGAAPGAQLVGLAMGNVATVYGGASAMNWVLENHRAPCGQGVSAKDCPPIKVINNSWGVGGEFQADSAMTKVSNALVSDGVTIAWAAGNDGGDGSANFVTRYAQNPTPGVIAVANYDDRNVGDRDNEVDPSSSRGEKGRPGTYPDVSAPGSLITAACRPYLPICMTGLDTADPDYNTISGTSMATPHIAGIVAQLLQSNRSLSPAAIEHALEDSAHRFTAGGTYEKDPRNGSSPTSFDKGHGLVDVVGAISTSLGLKPPAAHDLCSADGPVVVDRLGDATQFALVDLGAAVASEPSLDIARARVGWSEGTQTLKMSVAVKDLADANPPPAPGIIIEIDFNYDGATHTLSASRHDTFGESFTLDGVPVGGKFDPKKNIVSFTVTKAHTAAAELPSFSERDVLSDFVVRSRYDSGVVLAPVVDDADGRCPYTIGFGAIPPPPEAITPLPPHGAISVSRPRHSWTDGPITNLHSDPVLGTELFGCFGFSGEACHDERINVTVPAGGATLDVSIVADVPLNDFDLYVYDPSGNDIGRSVNLGTVNPESGALEERVTVPITESGVYRVHVVAYATFESAYEGTAELT